MDLFPLAIFPEGALDSSVITTVWIGVFVVAMFNLRFGWVLSGLVVPGYLVPLLIAKPLAAGVVVLEAVLTYGLVMTLAGPLARLHGWSSFFGRDRFFALVLVSVVVRLVMDAWLLVVVGEWLTSEMGIAFDYRNNLHSFGLIIIALIANQFWKTGLVRGAIPLVVTVGLTYLIVRFGLMELTNFRVSGLSYMFEDVTASILAGPKAYIILLTTALVASRMNLFYGWEFNGILIPSLLALQWYEPTKILISFLEAFLILGVGTALLKVPRLRDANIEGARKLLLFFNIAFIWKMLLSYTLLTVAPQYKVSDFFAFGYLLSTLMALKMHDKAIALRLTWSTLTTSAVAIVIASIIGFALTLLPAGSTELRAASATSVAIEHDTRSLARVLADEKRRLYAGIGNWQPPLPTEVEALREAARLLSGARSLEDPRIEEAAGALAVAGFELVRVAGTHLLVRERANRGWGLFVVSPGAPRDLSIQVPAPLREIGTTEAALWLFEQTGARTLAVGGPRRAFDRETAVALLSDRQGPFFAWHTGLDPDSTVQVRGLDALRGESISARVRLPEDTPAQAFITGTLPRGLNLGGLRERIGSLQVRFEPLPGRNVIRAEHNDRFAELVLGRAALRRMAAGLATTPEVLALRETEQRIDGYLTDWLFGERRRIAPRGSGLYEPLDIFELLFLDEEVLTPLLQALDSQYRGGAWTDEGIATLTALSARASSFGYRLLRYRHVLSGTDYVILGMRDDPPFRYQGTYVFRAGASDPFVIQVPRPEYERGSFEFGLQLFERLRGSLLMIAGAHPLANLDGSSDVTRADNARSLFSLVNQVVLRERPRRATTVVQARALGFGSDRLLPEADVLVSSHQGVVEPAELGFLARTALAMLRHDDLAIEMVDGDPGESGLEAYTAFQSRYLEANRNASFLQFWLSPFSRAGFRQRDEDIRLTRDLAEIDVPLIEAPLSAWLQEHPLAAQGVDADLRALAMRYARSRDLVALAELARRGRGSLHGLIDQESRRAYLALMTGQRVRGIASLAPDAGRHIVRRADETTAQVVDRFRETRAAWLLGSGATR